MLLIWWLLQHDYGVGIATVIYIVPDVTKAIWESLADECLPVPKAPDWKEIARGFERSGISPTVMGQ